MISASQKEHKGLSLRRELIPKDLGNETQLNETQTQNLGNETH